jgi:hypothetical protein
LTPQAAKAQYDFLRSDEARMDAKGAAYRVKLAAQAKKAATKPTVSKPAVKTKPKAPARKTQKRRG